MRALLAVVVLSLVAASPAYAEIQTRLVVLLGVKLSPAQAKTAHAKTADLAKRQIELFDDPSMTWGANQPPPVTYAGRVLASRTADRTSQVASAAVPTADHIAAVKRDLLAAGLGDDVQVVAIIVYSGGK
jgi:hypothetical protein